VNRALRISHLKERKTPAVVHTLPDWVQVNARLCYVSKRDGQSHHVFVKKIEQRQQMVLIFFENDRRVWKRVPFAEVNKLGDGTLKPLWKRTQAATVPQRPKDFVVIEDEDQNHCGDDDEGRESIEDEGQIPMGPVMRPDGKAVVGPENEEAIRTRSRSPRRT